MVDETEYDTKGDEYIRFQCEFYSGFPDESRKVLRTQIDFPLKGKRLLDAGCGTGVDLPYFEKKGADVYGIDISGKLIEIGKKENPSLKNLSVQSFEKTGFEDGFFDVIISRFALNHADDIERVFRELHRILKRGGFLIILTTHPLLVFAAKRDKDYHKREIVDIPIYNGKFLVKQPTHTFQEYLNRFVLENFEFLYFYESSGKENKSFGIAVPVFFLMKLRKK